MLSERQVVPLHAAQPSFLLHKLDHCSGFCRKVRFLGKIQKSGVRNSMTYRLQNSRKSNFATEPGSLLPAGSHCCPPPAGEVAGAACGHKPEPPLAAPGQAPGIL